MSEFIADIGDVVVLTHTVAVDGVAVDPSTVAIDTLSPRGVATHAEWAGGAGQVNRDAMGVFVYQFAPTEAGRWHYRWATTGTAQEADEGKFRVRRSAFV